MSGAPRPREVFLSYAPEDESLCLELEKHLSLLMREGLIAPWQKRQISAGIDWTKEIDQHLSTASIILLLISAHFLASDYCYSIEMQRAMARCKAGEAQVISILLRPVDWETAPFASLPVLPKSAEPLTTWANRDLAYQEIALALREILELEKKIADQANFAAGNNSGVYSSYGTNQSAEMYKYGNSKKNTLSLSVDVINALENLSRYQKKVCELKHVHNMLHEIEHELTGLTSTIQITSLANEILTNGNKEQIASSKWNFTRKGMKKREINSFLHINIASVEQTWELARLKISHLAQFAKIEMSALLAEEEQLIFKSKSVQGPSWIKDLLAEQNGFEASLKERNITEMKNCSQRLLSTCRSHMYWIDKRLLIAVNEADAVSNDILRSTQ